MSVALLPLPVTTKVASRQPRSARRRIRALILFAIFLIAVGPSWFTGAAAAQQQGRGRGAGAQTTQQQAPRGIAPVDLTGTWVAVITEDWRWRMVTAPRGDYPGVPLNPAGEKAAQAWDPAKDIAAGEQCRAYGAAGVMRLPTRLRITWQDDTTLKLETDAGQQVREFRFASSTPATGEPTWQGLSLARWESMAEGQGQAGAAGGVAGGQLQAQAPGGALSGSLKVVTTRMRSGYLRRNGVPYSADATLTEFFDRTTEANGDSWLVVTSIVEDPAYLTQPFMLTTHFKREPNAAKWNPRPCEVTQPVGPASK